jgi:hypothetical protein
VDHPQASYALPGIVYGRDRLSHHVHMRLRIDARR